MARFHETGLNFDEYVASRPTQRQGSRNVLVLQPLGAFGKDESRQLNELVAYTEAFFDTQVLLAPVAALPKRGQRIRQGDHGNWTQHHTRSILDWLAASKLPANAVCVLGVTMEDLYPEPSWNYVFGEATLEKRVGVYSLARYRARFWGEQDSAESRVLATLRSFKVLAHEAGHMFSLHHCRRYECLMNGSNSLEEMDRSPLEPCPVCLKMLQYTLRFDIRSRYRRLMALYERNALIHQRDWVKKRLERIGCG
jgi:archaemetzincin